MFLAPFSLPLLKSFPNCAAVSTDCFCFVLFHFNHPTSVYRPLPGIEPYQLMFLTPAEWAAGFQFCIEKILGHVSLEGSRKPNRRTPPLSTAGIWEDTLGQRDTVVYLIRKKRTKANNHWIIGNVNALQSESQYNSNNLQNSNNYNCSYHLLSPCTLSGKVIHVFHITCISHTHTLLPSFTCYKPCK